MYIVNAVDSFCDIKSINRTGNGEKKLYLSTKDSYNFIENYLGFSPTRGFNIYDFNDEKRVRTLGLTGYITKTNLRNYLNRKYDDYATRQNEFRTNLENQYNLNLNYIDGYPQENIEFQLDCSISGRRIYVGSKDLTWYRTIPAFPFPNETQVQIINVNNSNRIEFQLI